MVICIHVKIPSQIHSLLILQLNRHVVTIDGYVDVRENDEAQLLEAVAAQPVSVGICGSERDFQLYSKVCIVGLKCIALLSRSHMALGNENLNSCGFPL